MDKIEQFLLFEKEKKLFDLQYKGIYYWQLLRFNIYCKILHGKNASEIHPDIANTSLIKKLEFIPHIPAQIKQYFSFKKYDLLLSAPFIEKNINGKLIDPYVQFVIDSYAYKCNRNVLFTANWKKQIYSGHNNALLNALLIPTKIFYKSISRKFIKEHKQHVFEIVYSLNELFSINLDPEDILTATGLTVVAFSIIMPYYQHIIKDKYRGIVISSHYDIWQFALIAAARKCGIPTIEFQHGVIGRYGIAYNFKDMTQTGKLVPDYILTFGDYWSESCRPPDYVKLISVGFPLIDASKNCYIDNKKDDNSIVFISNGLIGREMSEFAISFAEIVVPLGYRIIYKFHPSECLSWRSLYPRLAETAGIEPVDAPINVHSILSQARHIVGIASTVMFEALAFGCNVYVWDNQGKEFFEDLIEMGYVPLFKTEKELFDLIQGFRSADFKGIGDKFFLPDSIKNIKAALDEIIKKHW